VNKVIFPLGAERVDKPDAHALHDLPVGEFRRIVRTMFGTKAVLAEFTAALQTQPKQIKITRGSAITGETVDGVAVLGELTGAGEGDTTGVIDFTGFNNGEWTVWLRFTYTKGESRNRVHLLDLSGVEGVALTTTRDVAGWALSTTLNGTDPDQPDPWIKLLEVHIDGGDLEIADLTDKRDLFFEGQADGSTYTVPAFSRDADRSVNGVQDVRGHALAVLKRLEELGGRLWYPAPTFGENVRAASDTITVGDAGGDATRVHTEWTAPSALDVTGVLTVPGAAGDERARVHFVPTTARIRPRFDLDTTPGSVAAGGGHPREMSGGHFRRTAGSNPLFLTLGGAGAGFDGVIEGFVFDVGTDEVTEMVRLNNATDEITFRGCTFDANGHDPLTALVKIDAAGRYVFERCVWIGSGAGSLTKGLQLTAAADVTLIDCTFNALKWGIEGGNLGSVAIIGGKYESNLNGDVINVGAIAPLNHVVPVPGGEGSALDPFSAEAGAPWRDGAVGVSGVVSGRALVTRSGRIVGGANLDGGLLVHTSTWAMIPVYWDGAAQNIGDIYVRRAAAGALVFRDGPNSGESDNVPSTEPRLERDGNRVVFADGAEIAGRPEPRSDLYPHFGKFQIGPESTDTVNNPIVEASHFRKRTILIQVDGTADSNDASVPVVTLSYAGAGSSVVNYTGLVGPAHNNGHSFAVIVGMDDADYRITATISTDITAAKIVSSASYQFSVQVLDKVANGFTLVPMCGSGTGTNGIAVGNLMWGVGVGVDKYEISVTVEW
jgi:hypothetical protein